MYRVILLIGLIIALIAFYLLTTLTYKQLLPFDNSLAQIFVAPIIILLLFVVRKIDPRVPFFVIIALLCGVLLSAFYRFQYPIEGGGGVLVAQLVDDGMFNKTRIFREKINSNLDETSILRVRSLYKSFSSLNQVSKFLSEKKSTKVLIWGNQRWIQIAFPKEPPIKLRELGIETDYYGVGNLSLIQSVPVIGLSYEPLAGTSRFIAEIALNSLSDRSEIALLAAGLQRSAWTASSHRAYPWFKIGNSYLLSMIKSDRLSINTLKCAERAYRSGLGEIRPNDNPELRAALFNNHAVSIAMRALLERRPRLLYSAIQQLKLGYMAIFEKDPYKVDLEAGAVSYDNLVHLLEAGAKKKSHRFNRVRKSNSNRKLGKHKAKKNGRKNSKRSTFKGIKRN